MLEAAGYLDRVVVGVRTIEALRVARRYQRPPRTLAFMGSQTEGQAFLAEGADIIRL